MNTVKELEILNRCSKDVSKYINEILPNLIERYKDTSSNIDKLSCGWRATNEIQSVNIHQLSYSCFSGTRGVSNTYSDLNFDTILFQKYFIKYLNKHTNEIFRGISDMMREEAIRMKQQAIDELDELKKQVEEIK